MIVGEAAIARNDVEDDFAAFEIKSEFKLSQPSGPQNFAQASLISFAIQHKKSAAAGSGNFTADRAVGLGEFIPSVDVRVGNAVGQALLNLPVHVEQLSETAEIAARNGAADLEADVFDFAQAANDGLIPVARRVILLLEDGGRVAHLVGIEHQNVVLETFDEIDVEIEACDVNFAVGLDVEGREAAERGHILILLTDGLVQDFEFDAASFLGEFRWGSGFLKQRVESIEQAYQVRAGRTKTGACGNVRDRHDFDSIGDAEILEGFTSERMLHFVDVIDHFGAGVTNTNLVVNDRSVDVEIHVFVNPNGENEAAMLPVEGRKVGPAAAQRNPKGRSSDDHRRSEWKLTDELCRQPYW